MEGESGVRGTLTQVPDNKDVCVIGEEVISTMAFRIQLKSCIARNTVTKV